MKFDDHSGLPIITPSDIGFQGGETYVEGVSAWVKNNKDHIVKMVSRRGGVIFRHFDFSDHLDFEHMANALPGKPMQNYRGGAVKRSRLSSNVFNSTELTRLYQLNIHHEMAYQPHYPDIVCFFCEQPARKGGETTLCDSREVAKNLGEESAAVLKEKGIRYVRTFQDRRLFRETIKAVNPVYVHLTWQDAFGTETPDEVEAWCQKESIGYEWRPNGDLALITNLPAFVEHPLTGEICFCNQIHSQHFNRRNFGSLVYGFRKWKYRSEADMPNQAYLGDGSRIPESVVTEIMDLTDSNTRYISWKKGDLLVVDNRVLGHGRRAYSGSRKVRVVMKKGV
ncbi:TauD/TfdA family dioxygenase [Marinobacter sp. LN3S78]|uniref:TauD/TfdA family dioxygenase n=1 Tax=Marinobacter sp. LN3S78 TaxID=3382300 RepID=UPI00387B8016